jgi:hypothetical protein
MFRQLIRDPNYPSRPDFAEAVFKKLSEDKRVVNLRHSDPVGTSVDFEYAGENCSAVLHSAYIECRLSTQSDEERDAFVTRWAADLIDGWHSQTIVGGRSSAPQLKKDMQVKDPVIAVQDLLPIVDNIDGLPDRFREIVLKSVESGESPPPDPESFVMRPLFEDLVLILRTDARRVRWEDIVYLGMTEDELWAAAFENLNSDRFSIVTNDTWRGGPLISLDVEDEPWLSPTLITDEDLFQGIMEADNIASVLVATPRGDLVYVDEARPDALALLREQMTRNAVNQRTPDSAWIFRMVRGKPGVEAFEYVEFEPSERAEEAATDITDVPAAKGGRTFLGNAFKRVTGYIKPR